MTAELVSPSAARPLSRASGWLRLARSPRPWAHAAAAVLLGFVLAVPVPGIAIGIVFGGLVAVPFLLVLLAAASVGFGWLGRWFVATKRGWWLALVTPVVWLPVAIVVVFTEPVSLDATKLDAAIWAGVASGLVALLAHRGPVRVVVAVVVAVSIVAFAMNVASEANDRLIARGQVSFGSTVRPFVVEIDGYQPVGEALRYDDQLLAGTFRPEGEQLTDPFGNPLDITLTTEDSAQGAPTPCGRDLLGVNSLTGPEVEMSCVVTGKSFTRASVNGQEIGRIRDGLIVRVSAGKGVPLATLKRALADARPMDDRHYRHLLLGESGEYIPELDGRR